MICLCFVAQRVAGVDALQSDARANVAGIHFFNFFALVGMHLQQTADALARALAGVVNVAAGFQDAGINADVGHVSDERVGHNFKSQRGKRLIIRGAAQFHFIVFRIDAFDRRNIHRRRQIIDHRIEQAAECPYF